MRGREVRGELIGITSVNVLHCDLYYGWGGGGRLITGNGSNFSLSPQIT